MASSKPFLEFVGPRKSRLTVPFAQHFWNRVAIGEPDDCWLWEGNVHSRIGYGLCSTPKINGWKSEFAHRVALFLTTGEWSERAKTCIRHLCNTPLCCNPNHLRLGTPAENLADAIRAGNPPGPKNPCKGESHRCARVTASDVPAIRSRMDAGESAASVAKDYGMSGNAARAIWKRETWKHVE